MTSEREIEKSEYIKKYMGMSENGVYPPIIAI